MVRFCFILFSLAFANSAQAKTVLLTGYWFPTNLMLQEFSTSPQLNPDGWKGKNWRGLGYDIYAFFPVFPVLDEIGRGDFAVDYGSTYRDFFRIIEELKPDIILSFGAGKGPWEVENNFPPYYIDMFSSGRIPSKRGVESPPTIPASLAQNRVLHATVDGLNIAARVNAQLPGLAWLDKGGDAGDFLCGFMGYLGAWYKTENPNVISSGFIHVNTDLATAKKALHLTLEAVLEKQK